jgi:hypothetical protein
MVNSQSNAIQAGLSTEWRSHGWARTVLMHGPERTITYVCDACKNTWKATDYTLSTPFA